MRLHALSLLAFVCLAAPAGAEEKKDPAAAPPPAVAAPIVNPHIQAMNDKAKDLASSMTTPEAKALGAVRENFGIIRSIEVARKTVGDAVKLCVEANPDLKEDMNGRFKSWNDALGAGLKAQEKKLKKAVSKDNFKAPARVQDYLDTVDKAAHHADAQLSDKIITTPEACGNLKSSMDGTEEAILGLIGALEWPAGAAKADDRDKAEDSAAEPAPASATEQKAPAP